MANLFRCGNGIPNTKTYFISHVECIPNPGGDYARTELPIPNDVKTIKVGSAYRTGTYSGRFMIYSGGGVNENINYNLGDDVISDVVIDVSGRKNDILTIYSTGSTSQAGSTVLKDVEFIF